MEQDFRQNLGQPIERQFPLDPRLAAGSEPVATWPLSQLRLKDDARVHWLLLVPRHPTAVELTDLAGEDWVMLTNEILAATRLVQAIAAPDKVNVASLGNAVAQLHVHVIGRWRSDPAWPDPVWCHEPGKPMPAHTFAMLRDRYAKLAAGLAPPAKA